MTNRASSFHRVSSVTGSTQHLIFLSHSGNEKSFVAKLDHALRNAGHDPFFDTHSLPLGEPFPPYILQNARTCKLGVVVLSPAFLTSYWPMLELNTMSTQLPSIRIIPLFFKIQPGDIKRSSPRFAQWKQAWHKIAERNPSRVDMNEWEDATARLSVVNGIVYDPRFGEDFFIQKVVRRICRIVPPLLRYNTSHLTGHERLMQVVDSLFKIKLPMCTGAEARRALGFYAIGGQGKTTICKLMVNYYANDYAGKCVLMEFPSNNCNETQIVEQCKRALQQLTGMVEGKISTLHSFDECMQEMKNRLARHDVFIAIDNVWDISLGYAQRILDDIGLTAGSKILVTSRSKVVLSNLLKGGSQLVRPLPGLNQDEAHQLFINHFNRNQAGQQALMELKDSDVDHLIQRYRFQNGYHPVAVIALGVSLGRTGLESCSLIQKHKSSFLKDSDEKVNEVIRMNFDSIPKQRKDLFLDLALIYIPYVKASLALPRRTTFYFWNWLMGEQQEYPEELLLIMWLSCLHGDTMSSAEIKKNLRQLEYDGLLEIDHEFANISMHDLYQNLAIKEAYAGGRFVLPMKDSLMQVEDIKWADVERVVWSEHLHNPSREPVPRGMHLPKLRLLMINLKRSHFLLDLLLPEYMPCLRVLDVSGRGNPMSIKPWLSGTSSLRSENTWLRLNADTETIQGIPDLSHNLGWLSVLELSCIKFNDFVCIEGLVNLQRFSLRCASVKEVRGVGSLRNLKKIHIPLRCERAVQAKHI